MIVCGCERFAGRAGHHDLCDTTRLTTNDNVLRHDLLDCEAAEDLAGLWDVIDRKHEAAGDPGQAQRQAAEIRAREHAEAIIHLRAPVWRVEIEQPALRAVTVNEFRPR